MEPDDQYYPYLDDEDYLVFINDDGYIYYDDSTVEDYEIEDKE